MHARAGFVILFAITVASILLSIALAVAQIALKEGKVGTSARDTNEAFFAADTGIESVLFTDKGSSSPFVPAGGTAQTWNLVVSGLGNSGAGCAKVAITKDNTTPPAVKTKVISKGYNIGDSSCASSNPTRIEREVEVNY